MTTTSTAIPDSLNGKALPELVTKLLDERADVLARFRELAGRCDTGDAAELRRRLQGFRQVLIDYLALGHFEVYQCLNDSARTAPRCADVLELAGRLEDTLSEITQAAVDFDERYGGEVEPDLAALPTDLAGLGAQLEARIALEDRLIAAIRGCSGH